MQHGGIDLVLHQEKARICGLFCVGARGSCVVLRRAMGWLQCSGMDSSSGAVANGYTCAGCSGLGSPAF